MPCETNADGELKPASMSKMQMRVQQQPCSLLACQFAQLQNRPRPFSHAGLFRAPIRASRQSDFLGSTDAPQLRQQASGRPKARRSLVAFASGQHIRFLVPGLALQFGEQLKAVGGDAELGAWYLASAPFLSWTEGHNWIHHTNLPAGEHNFKLLKMTDLVQLVIVRDGGSVTWEEGPDRVFEVAAGTDGLLEVRCDFGDTQSTTTHVLEEDAYAVDGPDSEEIVTSQGWSADSLLASDDRVEEIEAAEEDLPDASAVLAGNEESVASEEPQASSFPAQAAAEESHANAEIISEPEPEPEPSHDAEAGPEPETSVAEVAKEEPKEESPAYSSNGSNGSFKTFGGAKASMVDEGTMLVTFSPDDDEEDAAVLAERLFGRH